MQKNVYFIALTLVRLPKKRSYLMALRWLALNINGPNKYLLTTKQGGHGQGRTFPICSVLTPIRKTFRPFLSMRL